MNHRTLEGPGASAAGQQQNRKRGGAHAPEVPLACGSGIRSGLAQAGNSVAWFPLIPFLEQFQALKAFEHVAFAT